MPQANYEPKIQKIVQNYSKHMPDPNKIQVMIWMDPKKLKPHPLNSELYDFEDDDREDLTNSMILCQQENGYPNNDLVIIDENNYIYSGHRRTKVALDEGFKQIRCTRTQQDFFDKKCLTDPILKEMELEKLEKLNEPFVKRDETSWKVVLRKYSVFAKLYLEKEGKPHTHKQRNDWCRDKTKHIVGNFKKMVEIYTRKRFDLIDKVMQGSSINDVYKEAMNVQPKSKVKYDKNRKDWIEYFKSNIALQKKVMMYANDTMEQMLKCKMGNTTSAMLDDKHGWEQPFVSTTLSNCYMSALSRVLAEEGYDSRTPREEPGLADVRILDISKNGYEWERIEVKVAEFKGAGSKTTIYSGGGTYRIKPHPFLIVIHDEDTKRQFVLLSDLTGKDWNQSGNKCEMSMNIWHDNHFDNKDDYVIFHGDGYLDNKDKFQIQCVPIEETK
tara:strand:- start:45 stop:1370 length:1326 start_codon:yes stop_codon:yes gene_type:complete